MFADSSLGNAEGGTSQNAHLICAADQSILKGELATVSLISYQSHHTTRSGSSTLLVEANAISEALAHAEWTATWLGLARDLHFDMRKRDLNNREFQVTNIMSSQEVDSLVAVVTDAKSLYDNLI